MNRILGVLGSLAILLLHGLVYGDVMIDIRDASIDPGGTGFVDVYISSNANDVSASKTGQPAMAAAKDLAPSGPAGVTFT